MRTLFQQIICCLAAVALLSGCGKKKNDKQVDRIYEVTRGSFNIVISASGTLDAIKRYNIEAPPVSKKGLDIIEAVDDQTPLKKGDLIVAFSEENYLDELEAQETKIEESEKDLMLHEQDYQMRTADSVSLIKKATDTRRDCVEELEKYKNEDAPLQKKNLQEDIEDARRKVEEEKENLISLRQDLLTASMGDEAGRTKIEEEIEASEETLEDRKSAEDEAVYNLRMFKQYSYPQKLRKLEQDLVKAEMDLQKQLVNATSQRIQLQAKIDSQKRVLKTQRKQRDELLENIEMLRVTAPVDGVISYGDPNPRRRNQQQKDIAVGTSMRPSELIGTIPDLSRLVVNLDIPEAARSKVDIGMRAEMRIKALSNVRLSGEVTKIADMASHLNFWDRTSPKIYPTVISIDQYNEALRTGMTVEVDMVSEEVKNVVFVPVEALYTKEGEIFCRVQKSMRPEERQVKTGRNSSSFVEILEGLEPGEKILLSREEL